ncbi:unnamed protein product [Amoebophrya sp. A120]|nr:unnamed protein product [Amoebophrya sp. A120]|eukprot:GSA120T00001074001.1
MGGFDAAGCAPRELLEEDFRGRLFGTSCILCCFRVSSDEVADSSVPSPYYALVSRLSYWPSLYPSLHARFRAFLAPRFGSQASPLAEVWLESSHSSGAVLDWRLPVGVTRDILFGTSGTSTCGLSATQGINSPGGQPRDVYSRGGTNSLTELGRSTVSARAGDSGVVKTSTNKAAARGGNTTTFEATTSTSHPRELKMRRQLFCSEERKTADTAQDEKETGEEASSVLDFVENSAATGDTIWELTVHFRAPSEVMLASQEVQESFADVALTDEKRFHTCYLNALRKAVFLWYGSANAFMRLPMKSQLDLLDTVTNPGLPNFAQYAFLLQTQLQYPKTWRDWRRIAIKFHFVVRSQQELSAQVEGAGSSPPGRQTANRNSYTDPNDLPLAKTSSSCPALLTSSEVFSEDTNEPILLGDVVCEKLPFLCYERRKVMSVVSQSREDEKGDNGDGTSILQTESRAGVGSSNEGLFSTEAAQHRHYFQRRAYNAACRFLVQGLDVSLDTPLHWLALHCSYLDQYLHVVVTSQS